MCRNIKPLFNFDPPATDEEIKNASLQFVRKLSGFNKPSKINEEIFNQAVNEIAHITEHFLEDLSTNSEPRNREEEAKKRAAISAKRFERSMN